MPEFDKPHIDISARVNRTRYQAPRQNIGGGGAPRIRAEHGALVAAQFEAAFRDADAHRTEDERVEAAEGVYIEVDLKKGSNPEKVLQRKKDRVLSADQIAARKAKFQRKKARRAARKAGGE